MKNFMYKNKGMTLPELILATVMLGAFTSVFVIVTQFTSRFFQKEFKADIGNKEDILNVHYKLYESLDEIKSFLSHAGYDRNLFNDLTDNSKCSEDPKTDWGIPSGFEIEIPNDSKICIREIIKESPITDIVNESFQPGLYILYSYPKVEDRELTFSRMPVRTIFCRPRPFCTTL